MKTLNEKFSIQIVHYSKLSDRRKFLQNHLRSVSAQIDWVTEKNFTKFNVNSSRTKHILGIDEKLIGMDLGINSRSLVVSRRRARIQGWILLMQSFIFKKYLYTTGSLPPKIKLSNPSYEVQCMHLTALERGLKHDSDWVFVLEDDAIPLPSAFEITKKIICTQNPSRTWINLNSGAGLIRTASDPMPNKLGLFRVKPASTRCSVAYLISRDLADLILTEVKSNGIPDWLPIDIFFQVALRKFRAASFWADPPIFLQGSETGDYASNLRKM